MNEPDSTQLVPVLVWHDPRVHLLDDTWLLTIFAVLLAIALPVIGSIFLSRWQAYLMATLAVLLVLLVASSEAPELRWYAPWLGTVGGWLDALLGGASGGASLPFAAFYAPSQYFVVLLEV